MADDILVFVGYCDAALVAHPSGVAELTRVSLAGRCRDRADAEEQLRAAWQRANPSLVEVLPESAVAYGYAVVTSTYANFREHLTNSPDEPGMLLAILKTWHEAPAERLSDQPPTTRHPFIATANLAVEGRLSPQDRAKMCDVE